jgi:hypothetical protein
LSTSVKSNNVTIDGIGHRYDLYDLIERYKTENEQIDEVLKLIPDTIFFISNYLNEEDIDTDDVFNEIAGDELNLYQLQFCLDYAIENKQDDYTFEFSDDLSDVLDMVFKKQLKGFDKYIEIPDFNPDIQFFAEEKLLLDGEKLPKEIYKWLSENDLAITFFYNPIDTKESDYIKVRQSFIDDSEFQKSKSLKSCSKLDNTFKWLSEQKDIIVYQSNRFKAMINFTLSLPSNKPYFLQFTGDFPEIENQHQPSFKLVCYADSCSFLDRDDLKKYKTYLSFMRHVFIENSICFSNKDIIKHFPVEGRKDVTIEESLRDMTGILKSEWNNDIYKEWKCLSHITIIISHKTLDINLIIKVGDKEYPHNSGKQAFYRNQKGDEIIIESLDNSAKNVLKKLEEHQEAMDFGQDFIKLQSMFLEDLMKEDTIKGRKQLEEVGKQFNDELLKKIADNQKKVSDALDPLKTVISENELKELRKRSKKKDDEDDEPEIISIYGYIGELLYKEYLDQSKKKYEYSADNGTNEYDFKLNKTYIDIKTTVKSVKDGEAPFYIHKTQYKFLKDYPNKDYRIIRLSLSEMGIKDNAKRIKDLHKGQDPHENPQLKNKCKELVKDYWNNQQPKSFKDEIIHEYKIKVEN